jgi:HEAT repeat protein
MIRKITINAVLVLSSLLICLLLLEVTLRTGWFDDADNPHPVWIPYKFKKIHDEIERNNWKFAKLNPHKFTDLVRSVTKEEGVRRIAILGDSFVWGTGIPYQLTWNHKLEDMINSKYRNIEVLHWGFPAWSTMDELSFLENHGLKYNIDMLIVDYVNNDSHMQNVPLKVFSWHKSVVVKVLNFIFPNAVSFMRAYLYNFLFDYYKDYGYSNWVNNLHSDENLKEYADLLQDFAQFCHSSNIQLLFVLTPSNHDEIYRRQFDKITPLLEQANIKYLDVYPAAKREYGHMNIRKLWANPGDSHPGPLLTDLFAREVLGHLEGEGVLSSSQDFGAHNILSIENISNDQPRVKKSLRHMAVYNSDGDIRREAVRMLNSLNDDFAADKFVGFLGSADPGVRQAAVFALGEIHDPMAVRYLLEALDDSESKVRSSAVLALQKKDDPRIVLALIELSSRDKDKYVRRRALMALVKYRTPAVANALIPLLRDDFYYIRKSAAIALGKLQAPGSVQPLIDALYDDSDEVRLAAAEALGEINESASVDALKKVSLEDSNPLVRDYAAESVRKITGKEYGKYRRKILRLWGDL